MTWHSQAPSPPARLASTPAYHATTPWVSVLYMPIGNTQYKCLLHQHDLLRHLHTTPTPHGSLSSTQVNLDQSFPFGRGRRVEVRIELLGRGACDDFSTNTTCFGPCTTRQHLLNSHAREGEDRRHKKLPPAQLASNRSGGEPIFFPKKLHQDDLLPNPEPHTETSWVFVI